MKVGVADYGMNVWYGGLYNIEERLADLKKIGYDGTERLEASSPSDAVYKAAMYRKLGADFSTCRGPDVQSGILWTAAFGKNYVWLTVPDNTRTGDFEVFCRRSNAMIKACAVHGIRASIHNHLWQRIENQQELEDFLKKCPEAGIVFDVGHLAAAGGNPVEIIQKYHDRIAVMHLKDVVSFEEKGEKKVRFCELGAGNIGMDFGKIVKALKDAKYDGWIHIEHDTHLRDPLIDLSVSRNVLKELGI